MTQSIDDVWDSLDTTAAPTAAKPPIDQAWNEAAPQPTTVPWYTQLKNAFVNEGLSAAGAFFHGTASISKTLADGADLLYDKIGLDKPEYGMFKDSARAGFALAKKFRDKAASNNADEMQKFIGESAGGLVPGASAFLLNVPYAALEGATEAHAKGDNEVLGAVAGAAKRYTLGKIFDAANTLSLPLRLPAQGTAFAVDNYSQTGDVKEAAKAAVVGSVLGLHGHGTKGVKDVLSDIRSDNAQALPVELWDALDSEKTAEDIPGLSEELNKLTPEQVFIHYGKVEDTPVLDPEFHGTGMNGSEKRVAQNYPDLFIKRIYGYKQAHVKEPKLPDNLFIGKVEGDLLPNNSPDFNALLDEAKQATADEYGPYDTTAHMEMLNRLAAEKGFSGRDLGDSGYVFFTPQSVIPINNKLLMNISNLHSENGGCTYNLRLDKSLAGEPFYSVAPYKERELVYPGKDVPSSVIKQYIVNNADLLVNENHSLGTWFDSDPNSETYGSTFLDVAVTLKDHGAATKLGRETNQKAIFDLKRMEEERLDAGIKDIPDTPEHIIDTTGGAERFQDLKGQRMALGQNDDVYRALDENGKPIGTVWFTKEDGGVSIRRIETAKDAQGTGVAEALFKKVTDDHGPFVGSTAMTDQGKGFFERMQRKYPDRVKSMSEDINKDTTEPLTTETFRRDDFRQAQKLSYDELYDMSLHLEEAMQKDNKEYRSQMFNNIEAAGDIHKLIDLTVNQRQLNETVGGKKTLAETTVEAKAYAKHVAEGLGFGLDSLKALSGNIKRAVYELQAWKDLLVASGLRLDELHEAAKSGAQADRFNFLSHLAFHSEMEALLKGAQADSSRLLGSFRIKHDGEYAKFSDITPEMLAHYPELQDRLNNTFERFNEKDIQKVMDAYGKVKGNIAGINKVAEQIQQHKFLNTLLEYTNTNLLMSPNTQMVNFLGNVVRPFTDTANIYTQATLGLMNKGAIPGDRVTFGEANARTIALFSAAYDAFLKEPVVGTWNTLKGVPNYVKGKTLVEILEDIRDFPENFEKYVERSGVDPHVSKTDASAGPIKAISSDYLRDSTFGRAVDKVLPDTAEKLFWKSLDIFGSAQRDLSFGLMSVVDKPFKEIHYRAETAAQVYREALQKEFNTDAEMQKYYKDTLQNVLDYGAGLPVNITRGEFNTALRIHKRGLDAAREGTWQVDLTGGMKSVEQLLQAHPLARLTLLRFFRTPVNLAKEGLRYSPLPLVFEKNRAALSGELGKLEQNKAIANQLLGFVAYTSCLALLNSGRVTGSHPQDKKAALIQARIPEHSIDWSGKGDWIQYDRLDPYSLPLSLTADLYNLKELAQQDELNRAGEILMFTFANSSLSKMWLKQISDIVKGVSNEKSMERYSQSQFQSLLPGSGMVRAVTGDNDPYLREAKSYMEVLTRTYAPELNRPTLDALGEPVQNTERVFGMKTTQTNWKDPVYMETARLGISLARPREDVGLQGSAPIKLSPQQQWEIARSLSEEFHIKDDLNTLVKSESYKSSSDAMKHEVLTSVMGQLRRIATEYYLTQPEHRETVKKAFEVKAKLLTRDPKELVQDKSINWRDLVSFTPKNTVKMPEEQ